MARKLKCECGTCQTCKDRAYRRVWRARNPEYGRALYHKHIDKERRRSLAYYHKGNGKVRARQRQGIVDAHLAGEVLAFQGHVCAICGRSDPGGSGDWHADHDHKTGLLRGMLCNVHNVALGMFGDNPELLLAAVYYMADPPAKKLREQKT